MARGAEDGYSLAELLVATAVTMTVTAGAGVLASGVQRVAFAMDADQAARMDARFTLEAIVRTVEQAGSYPYGVPAGVCGGVADAAPLVVDPLGDGRREAIRVRADVNPPNGRLGGTADNCDERGEDVLLAFDRRAGTVTRRDAASAGAPVAVSSPRVLGLRFSYHDADGRETDREADVSTVRVELTVRATGARDLRPRVWRGVARLRER
ncbi:MAG: PilW family protein [Vicinamibacterales bacterium]